MKNYINSQGFVSVTDTSDILYIQENVQLTGSLSVSGSFSVGNVTMKNARGPKIVVGNSLAGDTLNDCDYLDAGDGVQLALAIAAASPGYNVQVRPGLIQLTGAITLPNFVNLRFSGHGTVVRPSTLDRRAFILGTGCKLSDLRLEVTTPSVGATGTNLIQFATLCTIQNCWILTSGYTNATVNESLRYFVAADTAATNSLLHNVYLSPPNFQQTPLTQSMTAIGTTMTTSDNSPVRISDCTIVNGDIGIECKGNAVVTGCIIQAPRRRGMLLSALTTNSYRHIVDACRILMAGFSTDDSAGIEITTGTRAGGATSIISNCIISTGTSIPASSAGIRLSGTGNGTIISGTAIDTFPIGLEVAVGQTNVSAKGTIRGASTPVSDASPSLLNEMRTI